MNTEKVRDFEKIATNIDKLLIDVFHAGIIAGIKGEFHERFILSSGGRAYVSRRNYGSSWDDDQNFGRDSHGDSITYDEAMKNKYFKPMSKEIAEDIIKYKSSEGRSNDGYTASYWNMRAHYDDEFVFYCTYHSINDELQNIFSLNEIDPKEYDGYAFAANWLSDEIDENHAYGLFIPIKQKEYRSDGYKNFHSIGKALFLKVPKCIRLQYHVCFTPKQ